VSDTQIVDAQRDQLLGRIDGNVARILARQEEEVAERQKLALRVTRLEQWRWTQTGAAGMIGAALTALFSTSWRWPFSGQ